MFYKNFFSIMYRGYKIYTEAMDIFMVAECSVIEENLLWNKLEKSEV